ncbi:MAG TPA: YncE family protein [Streptosporangiaceae bacterium]|nr:YncE family protein [Streptosporangiaceae bacterium]
MDEMDLLSRLRDEVPAGVVPEHAETALRAAIGGAGTRPKPLRGWWAARLWAAIPFGSGRRRPGWLTPLAAAVAAVAVIAGTLTAVRAVHAHGTPMRGSGIPPGTVYVIGYDDVGNDTVTLIRTATNTVLPPVRIADGLPDIVVSSDGRTAYVYSQASGTVTPVRTATDTALPPVMAGAVGGLVGGGGSQLIAVTPDGRTAYVAHPFSAEDNGGSSGDTVTPVRTATGTALPQIRTGQSPKAIAITPDGKTAYVACEGSSTGIVTPIRTATNTALPSIKAGTDPVAIAITPDGKTAYVASAVGGEVTPIRTATNTVLPSIKVGATLGSLVITPDGKTVYAVDDFSGKVIPIRTATDTALPAIKVGRAPGLIVITPDGKTAYVLNQMSGTVTPIRTATNTALPPIKIAHYAGDIAITPDGKTLYVIGAAPPARQIESTVTVVRTATNTVVRHITIEGDLQAIAVAR